MKNTYVFHSGYLHLKAFFRRPGELEFWFDFDFDFE